MKCFLLPLNKINKAQVPWDLRLDHEKYQKEPWVLKKGKEYVTIEKDKRERGKFNLQKNKERVLSLTALQARLTYQQLIEFGYKLQ